MDDRIFMILANLLAIAGGFAGIRAARQGKRSRWTLSFMLLAFAAQCVVLTLRGEAHARCPITNLGEIFFFLGWALTLFYLAIGSAYRLSFLGTFSAPLIVAFQALAVIPGIYQPLPTERAAHIDFWLEAHASFSLLAYGALALSAVAASMFLVQDRHLKAHHIDAFSQKMPSVRRLDTVAKRLTFFGLSILSIGLICGFLTPVAASSLKLTVACGIWLLYASLLLIVHFRGLPPRLFARLCLVLFFLSLSILFLR